MDGDKLNSSSLVVEQEGEHVVKQVCVGEQRLSLRGGVRGQSLEGKRPVFKSSWKEPEARREQEEHDALAATT